MHHPRKESVLRQLQVWRERMERSEHPLHYTATGGRIKSAYSIIRHFSWRTYNISDSQNFRCKPSSACTEHSGTKSSHLPAYFDPADSIWGSAGTKVYFAKRTQPHFMETQAMHDLQAANICELQAKLESLERQPTANRHDKPEQSLLQNELSPDVVRMFHWEAFREMENLPCLPRASVVGR